jgi:hypothetical protein
MTKFMSQSVVSAHDVMLESHTSARTNWSFSYASEECALEFIVMQCYGCTMLQHILALEPWVRFASDQEVLCACVCVFR